MLFRLGSGQLSGVFVVVVMAWKLGEGCFRYSPNDSFLDSFVDGRDGPKQNQNPREGEGRVD